MKETLQLLVQLQEHNSDIRSLELEKAILPNRVKAKEAEIGEVRESMADCEARVKEAQMKVDALELDLKDREGDIEKLKGQLSAIEDNKAYQTLLREIRGKQADSSVLEDEILEAMTTVDDVRQEHNEAKARIEQIEGDLEEVRREVRSATAEIGAELAEKIAVRDRLAEGVPAKAREAYERLVNIRGGVVVAAAIAGSCGGCHMNLTPQTMNALLAGNDLTQCHSCGRILYIEEDAAEAAREAFSNAH